ncbi:hypothetical protein B0H14DRAFT_2603906 [Mycena olivaceomarginata]|nr:hypothetical protein B0H14DRAFT_2603906 [Mycena olivaceomarginata]
MCVLQQRVPAVLPAIAMQRAASLHSTWVDHATQCSALCWWLLPGSQHDQSLGWVQWFGFAAPPRTSHTPPRIGGIQDGGQAASDLGADDEDESGDGDGDNYEDKDQG